MGSPQKATESLLGLLKSWKKPLTYLHSILNPFSLWYSYDNVKLRSLTKPVSLFVSLYFLNFLTSHLPTCSLLQNSFFIFICYSFISSLFFPSLVSSWLIVLLTPMLNIMISNILSYYPIARQFIPTKANKPIISIIINVT